MPKILFFRDGIEERIDAPPEVSETRDGHVVESYSIDGKKQFFVTLAGSHYCAHGSTVAEAIADAIWKDEARRPSLEALKSEIRAAGKERLITLNEFRILTGACAAGCRAALARKKMDTTPITAAEIARHFPDWGGKLLRVLEWGQ
jgi:hypothetical protein